jgi:peptide/nickel transport system substrate-binding protein
MRHFVCLLAVAVSLAPAKGALRPRYGGVLRIATQAAPSSAETAEGNLAALLSSGAFRITQWEPGRRAVLSANEEYRGGRPFVDTVEIHMGRSPREQMVDLELGRADVVEVVPVEAARAGQRGVRIWSSAPVELVALVFTAGSSAAESVQVRQALALSIDRAALHSVLLGRQGEPAGALLPQWLSGYAFLFPAARDLARAQKALGGLRPAPLGLEYEAADATARAIAERVAVNAREAGLAVRLTAPAGGDLRLVRHRLSEGAPARALSEAAIALRIPEPLPSGNTYEAERALLESYRVVPLAHLPEIYGLSPRVRNWAGWDLGRVWLDTAPP